MPNEKFPEARRIYQDLGKQASEARQRMSDPLNPSNPTRKADKWTRDTAESLRDKIYNEYKYDDRSLNYVPPADPKNYGR